MSTVDVRSLGRLSLHHRLSPSREVARLCVVAGAVGTDVMLLLLAAGLAAFFRHGDFVRAESVTLPLIFLPSYLLASIAYHSYSLTTLKRSIHSAGMVGAALATAAALAFSAAFALQVGDRLSRLETGYMVVTAGVLLAFFRFHLSVWLNRIRFAVEPRTILLVDGPVGETDEATDSVFDVRRLNWSPVANDPEFLDLVCRKFGDADRIVISLSDSEERMAWAAFMRQTGINAELVEPQLENIVPIGIGRWKRKPTLIISRGPLSLPERVVKRALDLTLTVLLLPAVVPLTALLAALIKLESPGPCLFVQDRVGKQNRRYRCYKLRTMRIDAADAAGNQSTSRDDARFTRIGRFLRRTSLDELPQLWNVLIGDMSLVGPRPHALGSKAEGKYFWEAVEGYWSRHAVKPGLTGLAQVRGFRGATESHRDIEERVAADLEYANSWSIWLDLKILLSTPLVLIHRKAY